MNAAEIKIQAECFQWLWDNYPTLRRCFFHVPNGGKRSKIEAKQLQASGLVPGIPDMILLFDNRPYPMEFKTLTGTLDPEQVRVHQAFKNQGVTTYTVRSIEQFKALIHAITTGTIR